GVREFDFSVGDEPYKRRFANEVRYNYALYLEPHPARLTSRINRAARHAAQIVRQKPAVKAALNGTIRRLDDGVSHMSRLATEGLLLKLCISRVQAVYRKLIWTSAEVLFFSGATDSAGGDAGVEIYPARLDALAFLSLKYPGSITEAKLRDY